jgi:hypothetical protein
MSKKSLLGLWFDFVSVFWKYAAPWIALAAWVWWLWAGFNATAHIYAAYDAACENRDCASICGESELRQLQHRG